MLFKLEEITWMELDRLDRGRTLVLIPISPIEEHGPHLPLGTDVMAAADIAAEAARRLVDGARLDPVRVDVRQGMRHGQTTFKQMGAELGYIGSPEASDPALGRLHLDACVRQTVDLALNLLQGEPLPPIDPRMKAFLADHVQLD